MAWQNRIAGPLPPVSVSPQTITGALSRCAERLARAGIKEARLEAELLLGEATGRGQGWLFLHPDDSLSPEQLAQLESSLARRLRREPLPYVLGHAEFYGLRFQVTPVAIAPRPETEILVEAAVERAQNCGCDLAADVGAGCGAIAVTMAKLLPQARLVAVDISHDALRLTQKNARGHEVLDRIALVRGNLLSAICARFDCIVANLPYIRSEEFADLQPEVRDWEPRIALDGGPDGLALIRQFSQQLLGHLRTGGFAALEVGAGQAGDVAKLLEADGLSDVELVRDYGGTERVVIAWKRYVPGGDSHDASQNSGDQG